MTKVQTTYELTRPLSEEDLERISRVHGVYGILAARLLPSLDKLFIEYDATRFSPKDVKAVLEQNGLPVAQN